MDDVYIYKYSMMLFFIIIISNLYVSIPTNMCREIWLKFSPIPKEKHVNMTFIKNSTEWLLGTLCVAKASGRQDLNSNDTQPKIFIIRRIKCEKESLHMATKKGIKLLF